MVGSAVKSPVGFRFESACLGGEHGIIVCASEGAEGNKGRGILRAHVEVVRAPGHRFWYDCALYHFLCFSWLPMLVTSVSALSGCMHPASDSRILP